jgi:DNA-binding response OmpR family regulator
MMRSGPVSTTPCILLIEGEILVRQQIAAYLRECGYMVLETGTTDEALLAVEKEGMPVDIVLADVKAPGSIGGFALALKLRTERPFVKVILSGSVATEAAEAADLCEEGPRLAKPYDRQILLDRIRRTLASRERSGRKGPLASS